MFEEVAAWLNPAMIPIILDKDARVITLIRMPVYTLDYSFAIPQPRTPLHTTLHIIGSVPLFGALMAYNLASAYRPEGC